MKKYCTYVIKDVISQLNINKTKQPKINYPVFNQLVPKKQNLEESSKEILIGNNVGVISSAKNNFGNFLSNAFSQGYNNNNDNDEDMQKQAQEEEEISENLGLHDIRGKKLYIHSMGFAMNRLKLNILELAELKYNNNSFSNDIVKHSLKLYNTIEEGNTELEIQRNMNKEEVADAMLKESEQPKTRLGNSIILDGKQEDYEDGLYDISSSQMLSLLDNNAKDKMKKLSTFQEDKKNVDYNKICVIKQNNKRNKNHMLGNNIFTYNIKQIKVRGKIPQKQTEKRSLLGKYLKKKRVLVEDKNKSKVEDFANTPKQVQMSNMLDSKSAEHNKVEESNKINNSIKPMKSNVQLSPLISNTNTVRSKNKVTTSIDFKDLMKSKRSQLLTSNVPEISIIQNITGTNHKEDKDIKLKLKSMDFSNDNPTLIPINCRLTKKFKVSNTVLIKSNDINQLEEEKTKKNNNYSNIELPKKIQV